MASLFAVDLALQKDQFALQQTRLAPLVSRLSNDATSAGCRQVMACHE